MNLLVLMYHRARAGRHGNSPEVLDEHFALIARKYSCVIPGGRLARDRLNVCLSFDDGYFDFHAIVFPLLKKHGLRAVLAVPPAVIQEEVKVSREVRMGLGSDEAFREPAKGGFCTWPELQELATSDHVIVAAHGFSHTALDSASVDLDQEIITPRAILRARLAQPVESFVFPFGRHSRVAAEQAHKVYSHLFRIGGAINRDWEGRLLYRVDGDQMPTPSSPFSASRLASYRARFFWNRLRGR